MPKLPADLMKHVKRVARPVMFLIVIWFVQGAAREGWRKLQLRIEAGEWSLGQMQWSWLFAAALIYSLGQLPFGLFWSKILAGLGQRLSLGPVLRAFYIGHLGKYVPGKAMVVVMRTSMLVRQGATAGPAAVSVFYETLSMMAAGAAIATLLILAEFSHQRNWLMGAIAMLVVTGLPIFPPVFEQIIRRLRIGKSDEAGASHALTGISFRTFVVGWGLLFVGWAMLGASIVAAVRAGGFTSSVGIFDEWTVATAAASLAVVIGFLSFIPGGFGVRDGILFTVLTWAYDEAAAMVTAILVRLIWLVAELLVSIILYKWVGSPRVEGELPGANADLYDAADAEA